MLKKVGLVLVVLVLGAGILAYNNQIPLMLAALKYRSATEYPVGPERELVWNAGPVVAEVPSS